MTATPTLAMVQCVSSSNTEPDGDWNAGGERPADRESYYCDSAGKSDVFVESSSQVAKQGPKQALLPQQQGQPLQQGRSLQQQAPQTLLIASAENGGRLAVKRKHPGSPDFAVRNHVRNQAVHLQLQQQHRPTGDKGRGTTVF